VAIRVLDVQGGVEVPMISRAASMVVGPHVGARWASMNVVRLDPGEMNEAHRHEESEDSIFILEGHGIILDFDNDVSHPVRAGSAVLVPPHLLHAVRGQEPDGLRSVGGPVPPDWKMLEAIGIRPQDGSRS
jgi:quercetin dioxygenase-like cupin family protein